MQRFMGWLGGGVINAVREAGLATLLFLEACGWMVRRPWRIRLFFKHLEFIGVNSVMVVGMTSLLTGMVLAMQTYYAFRMFAAESLVGATVALSMTRELGPVITALMVTGRAGSAIAAEIGSMRVTEQIDALRVMAVSPVQYLVAPRILAGLIMVPLLTALSDLIGVAGGYLIGVKLLGINAGIFMGRIYDLVDTGDVFNGLAKAAVFGVILTLIGCYKGYYTSGGAEGVGRATTNAVVVSSVLILVADYIMTALLMEKGI